MWVNCLDYLTNNDNEAVLFLMSYSDVSCGYENASNGYETYGKMLNYIINHTSKSTALQK